MLKLTKNLGIVVLVGGSPIGVLVYFALAYESVAAMVILGILSSIFLMILGATITLVGQHVHSKLSAGQFALNMQENSAIMSAYGAAMKATTGGRKTDVAPETTQLPALIIDQDAFSELDQQYTEAL